MSRKVLCVLLICLSIVVVHAQESSPSDSDGYQPAAQDSHGRGIRYGVYMQTIAYVISFVNLLRLDVRSQITGIILGFQIMIRWVDRISLAQLSPSEAWIILAETLIFTTPGIWLMKLTYEAQRYRLRIKRRKVVKGQGFNIILVVLTTTGATIANLFLSVIITFNVWPKILPSLGENLIWLLGTRSITSTFIKAIMFVQAILHFANLLPAAEYVIALGFAVREWWLRSKDPDPPEMTPEDRNIWWKEVLEKRTTSILVAIPFIGYCALLTVSIEYTIQNNNLHPETDLLLPSQLIPLITGSLALLSAILDVARPSSPGDTGPFTYDDDVEMRPLVASGGVRYPDTAYRGRRL